MASSAPRPPSQTVAGGILFNEVRLSSLDGWRAISIWLVLQAHCLHAQGFPPSYVRWWARLSDGDLGVRFFFVISGFLITWLLLKEVERSQHIHLGRFYVRRALRILPAYLAFLLVLALLQEITPYTLRLQDWIRNLTFVSNYFAAGWPSAHLWSLSVEEQFYLVWPISLFVATSFQKLRLAVFALCVLLLICPILRAVGHGSHIAILSEGSFFLRADSLAIGCLCAFAFRYRSDSIRDVFSRCRLVWFFSGLTLLALPHFLILFPPFEVPLRLLGNAMQGVGFSVFMLWSIISPGLLIFRPLNWRLIRGVGILSYSLYLWRQLRDR